jgi:hypothetical protein
MSIDLKTETIIDLKQAPPYLGRSRNGRPVHYSYLVRAIRKGINGHRLEALRIGNRWITSVEALQRWAEIQTLGSEELPVSRPLTVRRRAAARADEELTKRGL